MAIGYTRETWVDGVQLVDAARLNNIETGVQAACDELDEFYDSSTKAITAPGDVKIQELGANINIGSPSIWVGLDAYLNSLRLQSLNLLELIAGDAFQSLASQFALKNYGGDIIIQNFDNSAQVHGDIKLVTDGQAMYNGVEIATKAEVGESGTDLNTLTSEGMYQIQNPNNAPSGVTGWVTLSVIPTSNDSTYCRQMLYIPSSDDMYTRNNAGGTWGSWNKLALKSDLPKSYSAAWTATASSSYGTQLSGSITVPSGLYLLSMRTPYSTDTATAYIGLGGYSGDSTTLIGGSDTLAMAPTYDEKTMIVRFTASNTIHISAKASNAMTWDSSYLTRGGLTAIRLAD